MPATATPTIQVRALDANWDPIYGSGASSFLVDIDAVAQLIKQTILLLYGEWWEALTQGTPLFQSMLGASGSGSSQQAISAILQQRILSVPYVSSISSLTAGFNQSTRAFAFSATIQTQFGTLTVTNVPTPPSSALYA